MEEGSFVFATNEFKFSPCCDARGAWSGSSQVRISQRREDYRAYIAVASNPTDPLTSITLRLEPTTLQLPDLL